MIPIRYPKDEWRSPCEGTDLPYDWVPIALDEKGEELASVPRRPIWHDGANPEQATLYSGELRCTLKALSPLLVGNEQIALKDLDETQIKGVESAACVPWPKAVEDARNAEYLLQKARNGWDDRDKKAKDCDRSLRQRLETLKRKHKDKKILFPLTLGRDGRVLLPGEALKGMFRHAFGALFSAPLERVDEESYSYRPNVVLPAPGNRIATRPFAAKVERFDAQGGLLEVRLIRDLRAIQFVRGQDLAPPAGVGRKPCKLKGGTEITNKIRDDLRDGRSRWIDGSGSRLPSATDYYWLNYHFGLNGNEGFVKVAGKSALPHPSVLVPAELLEKEDVIKVDPAVVRAYLDTIKHLRDAQAGHQSRNMPTSEWRPVWPVLKPGDLIFCEWLEPAAAREGAVISFGHNFRYRWKHLNTVNTVAIGFDETRLTWITKQRVELSPHPDEAPSKGPDDCKEAGPPRALTAVRNLFGYVVDDGNLGSGEVERDGFAALKDPFDRLAGRISFNIALERINPGKPDSERFVNADRGCLVFLHPTVSPQASFSRGYVPGADNKFTWGDGLLRMASAKGGYWLQNGMQRFGGRKFYLHQFRIEKDASGKPKVPTYHYDLEALIAAHGAKPDKPAHSRWELVEYLWSDQSSIACRVSRPGSEFGLTVRFKDLRAHELAALTGTLTPGRLAAAILKEPQRLHKTSAHLKELADGKKLVFAHKLGHGRALGMGSVQIRSECRRWPQTIGGRDQSLDDAALDAMIREHLLPLLDDTTTLAWFKVLQLYPTRAVAPYLLHRSGGNPEAIVKWAQAVRAEHLKWSRNKGFGATPQ